MLVTLKRPEVKIVAPNSEAINLIFGQIGDLEENNLDVRASDVPSDPWRGRDFILPVRAMGTFSGPSDN